MRKLIRFGLAALWLGCVAPPAAGDAGVDGGVAGMDAGAVDAGAVDAGARPHPLYPSLDLASLPGPGGATSGAYEPPSLPTTTRTVG